MDTPPKSLNALKALTARPFAVPAAPPKVVVNQALPEPKLEPEELTDLTDDANLEMWALGGTKIIGTPAPPSIVPDASPESMAATMAAQSAQPAFAPQPLPPAPQLQPSYPPMAISYAPASQHQPQQAKKSNAMAWIVGVGLAGLFGLVVVAAGIGLFIYRTNRQDADLNHGMASKDWQTTGDSTSTKALAAAPTTTTTVTTSIPVTATPTPTALTATTATARTVTTTANVPVPPPTATATVDKPASASGSGFSSLLGDDDDDAKPPTPAASPKGDGTLQTYAAAAGKPVFVDGTRVGTGGSRIKTACGKHLVAVGTGKGKTVNIPCDGSPVTVGSPDGT